MAFLNFLCITARYTMVMYIIADIKNLYIWEQLLAMNKAVGCSFRADKFGSFPLHD